MNEVARIILRGLVDVFQAARIALYACIAIILGFGYETVLAEPGRVAFVAGGTGLLRLLELLPPGKQAEPES